jgi:hypothetical protein
MGNKASLGATLEEEELVGVRGPSFFPQPEDFSDYFGVSLGEFYGPRKVLVSLDLLRTLIGLAAAGVAYDPSFYEGKYQDLRDASREGLITDLYEHFVNQGYFEKRAGSREQAFPVDEAWYVTEYPDVGAGVKAGTIESASEHYFSTGRKEGRLPSSRVSDAVKKLIVHLRTE